MVLANADSILGSIWRRCTNISFGKRPSDVLSQPFWHGLSNSMYSVNFPNIKLIEAI
jgi:hypothetical protein